MWFVLAHTALLFSKTLLVEKFSESKVHTNIFDLCRHGYRGYVVLVQIVVCSGSFRGENRVSTTDCEPNRNDDDNNDIIIIIAIIVMLSHWAICYMLDALCSYVQETMDMRMSV